MSSHLLLGLSKGPFTLGLPVKILGLPVKIWKALLLSSILATCPALHDLLDLITLTILGKRYKFEVPHCGAFSIYLSKMFTKRRLEAHLKEGNFVSIGMSGYVKKDA